jgi:hypothetical protein
MHVDQVLVRIENEFNAPSHCRQVSRFDQRLPFYTQVYVSAIAARKFRELQLIVLIDSYV